MFGIEYSDRKELIPHFGLGKDPTHIIPVIDTNIQAIDLDNQLVFYSWDIRGPSRSSRVWRSLKWCLVGYDVLVFVVDATDRGRLFETRDELGYCLDLAAEEEEGKEERETALLILVTRCDYPHALGLSEIRDAFERELMKGERKWRIQGCDATTGEGVIEGLEWIAAQFSGVVP